MSNAPVSRSLLSRFKHEIRIILQWFIRVDPGTSERGYTTGVSFNEPAERQSSFYRY